MAEASGHDLTPQADDRLSWVARIGGALAVLAGAAAITMAGLALRDVLAGTSKVPWVLARASGLTSYVLLVALVTMGLVLAHPWARRLRRPTAATRLRLHVALATFTLAFTAAHVVVLATDPWAQVGWRGALLPMASEYRPVPVALGVLAAWAGLIVGVTARLAGSLAARLWWPVHKVASGVLVLVWAHSVLAGSDTRVLRWFYVATGVAVLAVAVTRYSARAPADTLVR